MGIEEFSISFDVRYNNISSNRAPSLNGYEKSVFLTQAQDELMRTYFFTSGEGLKGFDGNQKRQIDFSNLIRAGVGEFENVPPYQLFDPRAYVFKLSEEDKVMFIINEALHFINPSDESTKTIRQVIPISYDEYTRIMSKPYKEPKKDLAWRLLVDGTVHNQDESISVLKKADIIIRNTDILDYLPSDRQNVDDYVRYIYRYVKYPRPIILTDLTAYGPNIKIHGEVGPSECELDETVHEEILQKAVELAKNAWAG